MLNVLVMAASLWASADGGAAKGVSVLSSDDAVIRLSVSGTEDSELRLREDGTAEYRGSHNVPRYGVWRKQLSPNDVQALAAEFIAADFLKRSNGLDRGMERHKVSYELSLRTASGVHSVPFDSNRHSADLQRLAARVREVADRGTWLQTDQSEVGTAVGESLVRALFLGKKDLAVRCRGVLQGPIRLTVRVEVPPQGEPQVTVPTATAKPEALLKCVKEWVASLGIQPLPEGPPATVNAVFDLP